MKKIYLCVGVVFLLSTGIFYANSIFLKKSDSEKIEKIYLENQKKEKVTEYESVINKLEKKKLLKKVSPVNVMSFKNDTAEKIVYFGRNDCEYCQVFVHNLGETIDYKGKKIYYVDTNKKDSEDYEKMIEEFNIEVVPTTLKISKNSLDIFDYEQTTLLDFFN